MPILAHEPVLRVEKLLKRYGSFEALRGIDFEVGPGEIFALVGPNGAGKSTTLKILATILSPSSGTAFIANLNLAQEKNQLAIRKIISYLPEEAGAYKSLSGIDYLKFMAALFAEDRHQEKEYVAFASEISGLKDKLKQKVGTYSKGMTRKLLLARTIMSRPRLVILDEPTSGLDVVNAFEIRSLIKDLARQRTSVLVSSHNMLETEFLSDRIAILNDGRIVESGKAEALKEKYRSKNLEEVFVRVTRGDFNFKAIS